jgi:antitoxin MazE
MKTRIVRIGNSLGVRIPKRLIEQAGLSREVEIVVRDDALVISKEVNPRAGWGTAFQEMATHGDDALLDDKAPMSNWDEDEWRWP